MRIMFGTAATAAVAIAMAGAAEAGLDRLHTQRIEGGRLCMTDHWHYKSSGAWPTRAAAEATVRASWRRFTAAEYGAAWGDPTLAADARLDCVQGSGAPASGGRGETWSCNLKARPCRR